jgi:Phytanoyl-CoA dioxygenase (PhyH)
MFSTTSFTENGYVFVPNVLTRQKCTAIVEQITPSLTASGGSRCLLTQPWCVALAKHLLQHSGLSPLIPAEFIAVQCTYFQKSAAQNWLVPFHQDLSIPVAEKVTAPELQGWSHKEGGTFVQAPTAILEQLVAVRLHLDPCGEADGALRLIPGSHRYGRIAPAATTQFHATQPIVTCPAQPGDILILRPLILHASSKATGSSQRRVLHFLFAPPQLPYGLSWRPMV